MHDLNLGTCHQIVRSERKVPSGKGSRTGVTDYRLLIDGELAGSAAAPCRITRRRSNSPDGSRASA